MKIEYNSVTLCQKLEFYSDRDLVIWNELTKNMFKTELEAQQLCDKLNTVINEK